MGRLFGTDGARGVANSELTCELAMKIGRATAMVLTDSTHKRPRVLIGMDTRASSEMLEAAISAGLCSVGADVLLLGVVPTPAVAFLVQKYQYDAGIMISASHNPCEYNGIKIFKSDGYKLPDALEEEIEAIILVETVVPPVKIGGDVGRVTTSEMPIFDYITHLCSTVDYRFNNMKIALDCANGSSSITAPEFFMQMGAECDVLSNKPDGVNINDNCGSTHLENLQKYVVEHGLMAGFAFDGDADRCICVDETGNPIDGDSMLAALALDMKQSGKLHGGIVGTVMSNCGLIRFCDENGIRFLQTKVGDRYVSEEMRLWGFNLGGEQSGHMIFGDIMPTGDGQLTAIMLFSLVRRTGKTLSELASVIKKMPQLSRNIPATAEQKIAFLASGDVKRYLDEVRERLGKSGRLVARPSGTEPCIRLTAECGDETLLPVLLDTAARKISALIKNDSKEDICAE